MKQHDPALPFPPPFPVQLSSKKALRTHAVAAVGGDPRPSLGQLESRRLLPLMPLPLKCGCCLWKEVRWSASQRTGS